MRNYSDAEDSYVRTMSATMSDRDIGTVIGRTKNSVREHRQHIGIKGLKPGRQLHWTDEQIQALKTVQPGITGAAFARQQGLGFEAVRFQARKLGIKFISPAALRRIELGTNKRVRARRKAPARPMAPTTPRVPLPKLPKPVKPQEVPERTRKVAAASRISWCPSCHSPVSNQAKHYERMPECRRAA